MSARASRRLSAPAIIPGGAGARRSRSTRALAGAFLASVEDGGASGGAANGTERSLGMVPRVVRALLDPIEARSE